MFKRNILTGVLAIFLAIFTASELSARPTVTSTISIGTDISMPEAAPHPVQANATQSGVVSESLPPVSSTEGMPATETNAVMSEGISADASCGYWECLPLEPLQDDIYYTVTEAMTATHQASKWGIRRSVFLSLNPGLTAQTMLEPGQKLLVESRKPTARAPYSRGRANRGKLSYGRLMPEGEGYFLRTIRNRSWGTDTTIQAMMTVFKAYSEAYPEGPDINVGDLSKRNGGKVKPHTSHQSGRDIDIGFVHHPESKPRKHPEHFIRADNRNLDVEKTWFITKALIRTGLVQVIYIDKFVQKKLWQHASKELTKEQQELIFSLPRHKNSSSAILQHWPGHRNHFHIRFKCPKGQFRCKK